jgi:FkbM family methyltransferase
VSATPKTALARLLHGEQRLRMAGRPLASARRLGRGAAGLAFDYQGLRRRILRTFLFHAVAPATPIVAIEKDDLLFLMKTADLGPGRIMFTRGSLESEVLDAAVRAAGSANGSAVTDRLFLDVGANIGAASVLALGRHGFKGALAVEPNSANVALLRANLAVNGLEGRCTVVTAAAGGAEGQAELELSPDNFGDHRVRHAGAGPGEFQEEQRATSTVPVRRLDSLLESEGLTPADVGLLWVDVQGYEGQVLEGATALLRGRVPVVIEFWPYGLRRAEGLDFLCDLLDRHFDHFVDLHRALEGGGGLTPQPIARLRSFDPAQERGVEATDLLLIPPPR